MMQEDNDIMKHRFAVLILTGQVRGGKNSMQVTRGGQHYPNPLFAKWRNGAVHELDLCLQRQFPRGIQTIGTKDFRWLILYTPEDNRRRDVPAVLDALFHVFEKSWLVQDDRLIKNIRFIEREPAKDKAGVVVYIYKPTMPSHLFHELCTQMERRE